MAHSILWLRDGRWAWYNQPDKSEVEDEIIYVLRGVIIENINYDKRHNGCW